MENSIEVKDLTKVYPNGTRALEKVTSAFNDNEITVILGPSGAGKSTLLRCMNRLLRPSSGSICLRGKDITHAGGSSLQEVRKRVGMIFQQFNLAKRLTVLENVLAGRLSHVSNPYWYGMSLFRLFSSAEKDYAFECLKKVNIENLAYQRADTLSGGQQQRVAIARTLAQEPFVFLADEPVASLDPRSSEIVMKTLTRIQQIQHIPVVVNLHQIELARSYACRVIGMAEGRIVFDGCPAELTTDAIQLIYNSRDDCHPISDDFEDSLGYSEKMSPRLIEQAA